MTGENIDSHIVKYAEFLDRQIEIQIGRPYSEHESIEKILGLLEKHRAELDVEQTTVEVPDGNRPEREYIHDNLQFLEEVLTEQDERPYGERESIGIFVEMLDRHKDAINHAFPEITNSSLPSWGSFVAPLPPRARKLLQKMPITSVEDLASHTEDDFYIHRQVGVGTVNSIKDRLGEYGLSLAEAPPKDDSFPKYKDFIQGLGGRVRNGLGREGIASYEELLALTPGQVRGILNIGDGSLGKIQEGLAEHDLSLASGEPTNNYYNFQDFRMELGDAVNEAFELNGIDSYEALTDLTPQTVLSYEGIGLRKLEQIQYALAYYNLSLKSRSLDSTQS